MKFLLFVIGIVVGLVISMIFPPNLLFLVLVVWLSLPFLIFCKHIVFELYYSRKNFCQLFLLGCLNYCALAINIWFSRGDDKTAIGKVIDYMVTGKGSYSEALEIVFLGNRTIDLGKMVVFIGIYIILMTYINYKILQKNNSLNMKLTKDFISFILTFFTAVFALVTLVPLTINKKYIDSNDLAVIQGSIGCITMGMFPILGTSVIISNKSE